MNKMRHRIKFRKMLSYIYGEIFGHPINHWLKPKSLQSRMQRRTYIRTYTFKAVLRARGWSDTSKWRQIYTELDESVDSPCHYQIRLLVNTQQGTSEVAEYLKCGGCSRSWIR